MGTGKHIGIRGPTIVIRRGMHLLRVRTGEAMTIKAIGPRRGVIVQNHSLRMGHKLGSVAHVIDDIESGAIRPV